MPLPLLNEEISRCVPENQPSTNRSTIANAAPHLLEAVTTACSASRLPVQPNQARRERSNRRRPVLELLEAVSTPRCPVGRCRQSRGAWVCADLAKAHRPRASVNQ